MKSKTKSTLIKRKLIRITTIPLSLEKLLENQLRFMSDYFNVTAISAEKERLEAFGKQQEVNTFHVELTRQITPLKDLKAVWKLYKFLKQEQPFVVHTHTPKAGIVGMLAAYLAKVPNRLHTVAGLPLMEANGLKRVILNTVEKLTYACASKVYPNSAELRRFIETEGFTKASKLKIIGNGSSNGINTAYFNPEMYSETFKRDFRTQLSIEEDDRVLVYVGRIVSDKGINELVDAFKKITANYKHIKLLLVGPLETELDPLLPETLNVISDNNHIISVGYQVDVRPYFSISDMLVFPSYREGFPNVVMQAGAMGLPSIVTNINGCNEIIKPEINGLIIPVKDTEATYNAITKLLNDQLLFQKLKNNSRKIIVESYEQHYVWEELLKEYRKLDKETI